jgi:thymidylate kinase
VGAAKIPSAGPSPERTELLSNRAVGNTWLTIALLDLALFYGLYARWLSLFGSIVICDRYIEDTEIDFQINFPKLFDNSSKLWKLLTFVTPSIDCSFLLYVPVDLTLSRSEEKNEPFPDSAEILDFRLLQYMNECRFPRSQYIKIDGMQDIEVIRNYIYRCVEKLL